MSEDRAIEVILSISVNPFTKSYLNLYIFFLFIFWALAN